MAVRLTFNKCLVVCSVLLLPEGADVSSQAAPAAATARGAPAPPPLEDLSGLLRAATPCGTALPLHCLLAL